MRKGLSILLILAMMLALVGCSSNMQAELDAINAANKAKKVNEADEIPDICQSEDYKYEVALCSSGSRLKDNGFNEYTYNGVKLFANDNGKTYKYYLIPDSSTDNDCYETLRAAINNGAKVVVAVAYEYTTALKEIATEYPEIRFIFIDGSDIGCDNVAIVTFKENEGGYLAGYSAVMDGYTRLGFVGGGGGSNDAVNRYGRGFVCGANDAAKKQGITVEVNYSYQYATTFVGSPELQAMSNAWYSSGTEVIFSACGAAQDSVAASAAANDAWIIACDADASDSSSTVLTSALKKTDVATKIMLECAYDEYWEEIKGKITVLGMEEGATGLSMETSRFRKFSQADYEALCNDILSGKVEIDTDYKNNCTTENLIYKPM